MARRTYVPGAARDLADAADFLVRHRVVILAAAAAFAPTSVASIATAIDAVISAAGVMRELHKEIDPYSYSPHPFEGA